MLASSSVRQRTCARQESLLSEEVRSARTLATPRKPEAFREGKGRGKEEQTTVCIRSGDGPILRPRSQADQ